MSIELNNISFEYKNLPLFNNFHLTLPERKCICLLGGSGVGKTTLLRIIANLVPGTNPDTNVPGTVSYLSQNDALLPWLSVLNNVLIGYRLRKENSKALKAKAIHLLKKVGLERVIHHYPKTLSGGMRQRVALARTFMENRSIVLMDEPFSALDAITRLKLQDLANELLHDKTVLLVTHDPMEALRLGDIIYILSGMPVQLSAPIMVDAQKPRNPANTELLTQQGQLLNQLSEVHVT